MKDILAEIVEKKRDLVAEAKRRLPFAELKARARERCGGFYMTKRFQARDWNLIAECKLQSPAKGRLCRTHTVDALARIYAENGASMLSVHTDPHFLGANEDLMRVRSLVDLPLLRKDFIIDEYQIFEARMLGADAVLLIARILSPAQLQEYVFRAWEMGLDALVEVHDEADMEAALATPAEFIGINNRNEHIAKQHNKRLPHKNVRKPFLMRFSALKGDIVRLYPASAFRRVLWYVNPLDDTVPERTPPFLRECVIDGTETAVKDRLILLYR